MLPLVIAVCIFLGSLFFSLEADAAELDSYVIEDIIPDLPGLVFDHNVVLRDYFSDDIYFISSEFPVGVNKYKNYDDAYDFLALETGTFKVYSYKNGNWALSPLSSYAPGLNVRLGIISRSVFSSSHAIYDVNGDLFFQGPPLLPPVLRPLNLKAVMEEILMILPLLILFLVSLIGLRKGLRFVSSFLHRA